MAIINEKNETFKNKNQYISQGKSISMHTVKELLQSGDFWAYNGFDVNTMHIGQKLVITKEENCIRRLTPIGYVTIALKTLKK